MAKFLDIATRRDAKNLTMWTYFPLLKIAKFLRDNIGGATLDLSTHDVSKCADGGNDCCASEDWGEAQACRDGYRPIPVTQDQCWSIHEGCAEYEGGKGCYGCFPPEGHNASGACLSCLFETLHLLKLSRLNLWIQSRYSRPEMQDHREVLRKEYKINQR